MMGNPKKFKELRRSMSQEAQGRSHAKAAEMLKHADIAQLAEHAGVSGNRCRRVVERSTTAEILRKVDGSSPSVCSNNDGGLIISKSVPIRYNHESDCFEIIKEAKYAVLHRAGDNACGGVAFWLKRMPELGAVVRAKDFITVSGEQVDPCERIKCGTCGATAKNLLDRRNIVDISELSNGR